MSCGNIKLVGYNNLNNVIIKEHGSNNADYYSLIAMVEDPIFKKIIADKGINVKTSGRQAPLLMRNGPALAVLSR